MKWMIMGLLAALLLIGLGVVLTGGEGGGTALSADPEAALLCTEGTEDANAFRLEAAVDKLGRALELDPSLAEAAIARAMALARLGRSAEYKAELARADSLALLIADDDRRMLAELRLSSFMGSRAFALRDSLLDRLKQEMPRNIHVLVAQAGETQREGDLEAQEQAWLRILEIEPSFANSYNMLGYLELHRGDYDQAIEYMQKYAFLAPDLANPHDSLGEVLMTIGRYEEAEEEFRAALKMQPDFFHSMINLGRVYLARGQIRTGREILEKVRGLVAGSELEKHVDREMVGTYVVNGLEDELRQLTAGIVARYPDDATTGFYRAMGLAYAGRAQEGQAVMDSCLGVWRSGEIYGKSLESRLHIDYADRQFDALVADVADDPATAARLWQRVVDLIDGERPFHETWFDRYRLATALRADERPAEALAVIEPILAANPRSLNVLVLAVRCFLDLGRVGEARQALDQLAWSVAKADADFPARAAAAELEQQVAAREGAP
ncbi:MAG: tetratricopeptide repeat protein [Krumholzibacteria bacterium]|nr:tetratricopeptide repeat protein [Candidatus Krumholzibacteria bacterium]